ncbi:MAG: 1,4-alpha-glucan branching protein GlgB [Ilumatobacteraceae bacterium]
MSTDPMSSDVIGPLDLHLFNEGSHRRLWELLGPQRVTGGVRFAVWAPNARSVAVVGDWNEWTPQALEPVETSGLWSGVTGAEPGHHYKYEVVGADGRTFRKADPMARRTETPPSDASVVPSFAAFDWHDGEWLTRRGGVKRGDASMRVYEVHLGSWRHGVADWDALAEQLSAHAVELGFTHIELLPVAEHPFTGSWGYQVSGYYAPTARFGDPDGFKRFVDTLHRRGVGVILDWVPAHFPRDEWSLGRFDGTALYEHADPRRGEHPDWGTYVFNVGRDEVRNFLVANALYWFDEFHVDGLRVDAVASMLYLDYSRDDGEWVPNEHGGNEDLDSIRFLREVNDVVAEEHPDVLMIAEESTAWPGVTRPSGEGGLGFTHKWNLGWMHDTLTYFTRDPVHRPHHHGDIRFTVDYAFSERFVLPLSHDEVVHGKGSLLTKMAGDDWQKFANLRSLLAWQWAMPGPPLLFMGSELAPWEEWTEASWLPWHLLEHGPHRGVRDLLHALNRAADTWPALWRRDHDPEGFQWLEADDAANSIYAFLRWDDGGATAVACIANLTPVPRPGYRVGLPWGGEWQVVLDTDVPAFGGSGARGLAPTVRADDDAAWQGQHRSAVIDLPPLAVVWLAAPSPTR